MIGLPHLKRFNWAQSGEPQVENGKTEGPARARVTIHEVARAAGVSIATVSLALADNPAVAAGTKERVRDAAARLSYSPSAVGRALRARRTNAVALVVPHSGQHVFSHLYFMDVLAGVSEVVNAAGMTMVLSTAPAEDEEEAAYLKILRSQQVDGIILASAALHDQYIPRLRASGYPFVFLGRYPLDESVAAIGVADQEGARAAVAHLLGHGHTRIAHISGPLAHLSAADRLAGYRAALAGAGVTPRPEYCLEGDYSEEAGRQAMGALLRLPEPPTALFAANDETAIGAFAALREAGREPGADFPVVGFDDVVLARLIAPPLTTVHQPMRALGVAAAELLLRLVDAPAPLIMQRELPVELVIRASCGCAPG
jgi:DNA-binding LacI/PurR family transcriptional regulator